MFDVSNNLLGVFFTIFYLYLISKIQIPPIRKRGTNAYAYLVIPSSSFEDFLTPYLSNLDHRHYRRTISDFQLVCCFCFSLQYLED